MGNTITKTVKVGGVSVGGGSAITVQSMLCVPWQDTLGNVAQAVALEKAGCDILRVAIPTPESVGLIPAIKSKINIPLVADIHFDYRLAVQSAEAGADKIRINPGNIGGLDKVKIVADSCRKHNIPIRIGVNSGSLEKQFLEKHGSPTPQAMVESALYHASLLEQCDFGDTIIAIKSSNVNAMVAACRLLSQQSTYPQHIGVTEAGTKHIGILKSAIGIGALLMDGIGDTIRVSLTADPIEEVKAAKDILKAIGLNKTGVNIIACPTCGRTQIDLIKLTNQVEQALASCTLPITVAVMGCVVNGPGEAGQADIAICGGKDCGAIYAKGEFVRTVEYSQLVPALLDIVARK